MSRSLPWGSYPKTKTRGGSIHTSHPSERPHWPTQSEETPPLHFPSRSLPPNDPLFLSRHERHSLASGTRTDFSSAGFIRTFSFWDRTPTVRDPFGWTIYMILSESHYRTRSAVVCWHSDRDLRTWTLLSCGCSVVRMWDFLVVVLLVRGFVLDIRGARFLDNAQGEWIPSGLWLR